MKWNQAVMKAIISVCKRNNSLNFDNEDLRKYELNNIINDTGTKGKTPEKTLNRVLQSMRNVGLIEFLDNHGNYRLLIDFFEDEGTEKLLLTLTEINMKYITELKKSK